MIPVEYGFSVEAKGATAPLFRQVHGRKVIELATPADLLRAAASPEEADGAFTMLDGIELYTFTADCIPLLFFDAAPGGPRAAVHCGWRGAKLGIARHAVELLSRHAKDLHVAIGPCLRGCCFEVKQDFVDEWRSAGRDIEPYLENRNGKRFCHLDRFVREVELGGVAMHTEQLRCTYCSSPELPSYRRNGGTDPRLRGWIRRV